MQARVHAEHGAQIDGEAVGGSGLAEDRCGDGARVGELLVAHAGEAAGACRPHDPRSRKRFPTLVDRVLGLVDDGGERADRILETTGEHHIRDLTMVVGRVVACRIAAGHEPVAHFRGDRCVVFLGQAELRAGERAHPVRFTARPTTGGDGPADPYDDIAGTRARTQRISGHSCVCAHQHTSLHVTVSRSDPVSPEMSVILSSRVWSPR